MKSAVFAIVSQLVTFAVLMTGVYAQAPAAPPAAPQAPVLDSLDKQAIELELEAAQAMNAACSALDSFKHYQKAQALVNAQIKAKYSGYVYNRQTRRLEPQPPPPVK